MAITFRGWTLESALELEALANDLERAMSFWRSDTHSAITDHQRARIAHLRLCAITIREGLANNPDPS